MQHVSDGLQYLSVLLTESVGSASPSSWDANRAECRASPLCSALSCASPSLAACSAGLLL